ncbi:glutamate--tRNA ligase [Ahniella affigens]|uniref:Glutamate--tRNA ligase n=1 Tax=Ahniella affigens TaxID=2021234 RepID=A0A2P1PNZ0_9GAMM|nr:glutamate--tRNA ligase [Ahniella affigens]AVP96560.1 glutamate--tRNA ligase [Ahniella affigens]
MTYRTRFAPSPTGFLHIGGARTALFCYLEARRQNGVFVLRIEDTDQERSTEAALQAILEGMAWLGLEHDEGPFYQTKRLARYREVAEQLLTDGKAYHCYCSKVRLEEMRAAQEAAGEKPRYDGRCRHRTDAEAGVTPVIRFRNPKDGSVVFEDKVRGRIEIQNSELDDLIIWRSDQFPTYNFAVVVDDVDMGITEIIRGEDHINNTPRQINIYHALGKAPPTFGHLPMIHGSDGAKLSKRHGAVSVMQYRDDGYLPHAVINYIARLGWSHGDQEVFSRQELIDLFRIEDVNRAASRFDFDKLAWLNQHYLKTDAPETVAQHLLWHLHEQGYELQQGPDPVAIVVALRERVKTLKEMAEKAAIWFRDTVTIDPEAQAKHLTAAARPGLLAVRARLADIADADWSAASVDQALRAAAESLGLGLGKVAPAVRVAVTGTQVSPSIDQTVFLCGRARALARIDAALAQC